VRALENVSLCIGTGEIVGLIGPNGSGKTTLINAMTGVVPADGGRVFIQHSDMTRARPHRISRAGVARTFQATALVETISARDNVAVACPPDEATAWLDALGAANIGGTTVGQLPFGGRRLVELARALATRPKLLLLDEPASGLTRNERDDLASRLRGFADDGLAILIVEHDMAFLGGLADRLICLESGRVIADGAPNTVRSDPRVIAAYLGG
jgi:branched-chain amino acid transport system permease protein